jgi:hypothetical protein
MFAAYGRPFLLPQAEDVAYICDRYTFITELSV